MARYSQTSLLLLLLVASCLAGPSTAPPSEPTDESDAFTERVPESWLRPIPIFPTEAVPASWLRPILSERSPPPAELGSGEAPDPARLDPNLPELDLDLSGLDGRTAVLVQQRWVTPLGLIGTLPTSVGNGQTLPENGKFEITAGTEVFIESPGYPKEYTAYIWTTWKIETTAKEPLQFQCPTYEIGTGDYLIITTNSGLDRKVFDKTTGAPDLSAKEQIQVEFRSNSLEHGKFRCSVRVGGSGAPIAIPAPAPAPAPAQPLAPAPAPAQPLAPASSEWLNEAGCGETNSNNRIVGGTASEKNQYPWLVGLMSPSGRTPFCGGSIINERTILTAAHCVRGRTPQRLVILVRKHKRGFDSDQVKVTVEKIITHPEYNTNTQNNDLALVRLSKSLRKISSIKYLDKKDGRVRPICLPSKSCRGCHAGKIAVLCGWGLLKSGGGTPNTVQHVQVPILTNKACADYYRKNNIGITSKMVCAGLDQGGKDSCQGDSGGPMMTTGSNNIHTQEGVVSFGKGCALAGYPGVYTRVSEFYDWIKTNSKP